MFRAVSKKKKNKERKKKIIKKRRRRNEIESKWISVLKRIVAELIESSCLEHTQAHTGYTRGLVFLISSLSILHRER